LHLALSLLVVSVLKNSFTEYTIVASQFNRGSLSWINDRTRDIARWMRLIAALSVRMKWETSDA